jgi:hypothetical protein
MTTPGTFSHYDIMMTKMRYSYPYTRIYFPYSDYANRVNIPALLDLAGRYHHACPVTVGYVWSQTWDVQQPVDYVSASAGVLMSQAAFLGLTPAFLTERCPSGQWSDMTFGRCAWSQKVQIVHHLGFYYGILVIHSCFPITTSDDMIWVYQCNR